MCGRASLLVIKPDALGDQLDADVEAEARERHRPRWIIGPRQYTLIPGEEAVDERLRLGLPQASCLSARRSRSRPIRTNRSA